MAQIKAHEFERVVANGLPAQPIILIYGPDRGLVSERADLLAEKSGVDLQDPFSVIRLDADALKGDPGRLSDEANAIGLFGGRRIIRLKGAGNDKSLVDSLAALDRAPPADTIILIEAGELKKGASLRKTVEDAKSGLAVPCYADAGRTIHALIDEEMNAADLRVTAGARERLLELLGGDRLASRGELRKLALYCQDSDVVDEDAVLTIIGDMSALSVDEAVDAVLTGRVAAVDQALQRVAASKTPIFLVLQGCLRQFQLLESMRTVVEVDRKPVASVLSEQGRRVHFQRKPAIEAALRQWSLGAIDAALSHLNKAILETRRRPQLADSIAFQALLALALRSAKNARN